MSTDTISFFNAALHSLTFGALGWLLIRFCLRDARRRGLAALIVLMLTVAAPWTVSEWSFGNEAEDAPALATLRQTLQPQWRIQVSAGPMEPLAETVEPPAAPFWDIDQMAGGLLWIWLLGAGIMTLRHLIESYAVLRWRRRMRGPTEEERACLPAHADVSRLRVFDHEGTPCAVGLVRPVIAVPAGGFQTFTATHWHWVLRHEGEHIRGGDLGAAFLLGLIRAAGWWNPFVHALIECWTRAREEVCDAVAVGKSEAQDSYADFLLAMAAFPQEPMRGVMPVAQSKPARRLRARLEALMGGRSVRDSAGWSFHLVLLLLVILGHAFIAAIGPAAPAQGTEATAPGPETAGGGGAREMFTRVYQVSPGFGDGMEARAFFEKKGVSFPPNASAHFNKATREVIVRNTRTNLEKISQVVSAAVRAPVQIHFSGKIIEADQHFGSHGQVLSGKEFQALIREVSQRKGIHLMSAPEVTTKLAQKATVEVIRENELGGDGKFVGLRLELNGKSLQGKKAVVWLRTEIGMDLSRRQLLPPQPSEQIDWKHVEVFSAEAEGGLASGEAKVMHMTAGGRSITVLVMAKAIQAGGSVAHGFDENVNLPPSRGDGDGGALPGEAYEREVQRARDIEASEARKQIHLSVKVVEMNSGVALEAIGQLSSPPNAQTDLAPKGAYVLSAVLTDAQFRGVIRNLSRQKGVELMALPSLSVPPEQVANFDLPASLGGEKLEITPVKGADGYTIDLLFATSGIDDEGRGRNTTAVTVFDGQTVVVDALGDGVNKAKRRRLLFVTSRMIEVLGEPKAK